MHEQASLGHTFKTDFLVPDQNVRQTTKKLSVLGFPAV